MKALNMILGTFLSPSKKSILRTLALGMLTLAVFSTNVLSQTSVFTTPGSFNYTVPNYSGPFQPGDIIERIELTVTIVGGGGGGGRGQGAGGGGGGQVRVVTFEVNSGDVLTGFIGSGGTGRSGTDGVGGNGSASSFNGTVASGGFGGNGSTAGNGGSSGGGGIGGIAAIPQEGNPASSRRAGGGGAGALTSPAGNGGNGVWSGITAYGGNGGLGLSGFGGGGGGASKGNGVGANGNPGTGVDGGTDGSRGTSSNATNGGGGGGGWTRGGNGGNGLVEISINYSILPVEFLDVKAAFSAQNQSAKVEWSTAKEWNNSHFEIERSIGGVADFKKIGEVSGKGWSDGQSNYVYEDKTLPNGKAIVYFRIRQVDFDGKSSISKVVSVQTHVAIESKKSWQAYPNPVKGNQINVKLLDYSTFSGDRIQARIIHANSVLASQELRSVEELNGFLQQQVSKIPKGVFVIEIKWADKVEHHKMLKAQ